MKLRYKLRYKLVIEFYKNYELNDISKKSQEPIIENFKTLKELEALLTELEIEKDPTIKTIVITDTITNKIIKQYREKSWK